MIRCLGILGLALLLALSWHGEPSPANASSHEFEARIVARRVASGNTEFAVQHRAPGGAWGDRLLPRARFFPLATTVDRWLASTPLLLTPLGHDASVEVRVAARKRSSGRD